MPPGHSHHSNASDGFDDWDNNLSDGALSDGQPWTDDEDSWPEGHNNEYDSDFDSMASDYDDDDDNDNMGTSIGDEDYGEDQDRGDEPEGDILENQFASMKLADAPVAVSRSHTAPSSQMCVVCHVRPAYSKGGKSYPTCGLTCAAKYKSGGATPHTSHSGSTILCVICGKRPAYNQGGKSYPTCGLTCASTYKSGRFTPLCVICGVRPAYNQGGQSYPTCGLNCAAKYKGAGSGSSSHGQRQPGGGQHGGGQRGRGQRGGGQRGGGHSTSTLLCVICHRRPSYRKGKTVYVTCGLTCLKRLCNGEGDPTKCNYCHRRPRFKHYLQCGRTCRDRARVACLMCRARPKNGKYHFCGLACKKIAMTMTPLIREVPQSHVTWKMVEDKFKSAWKPPNGAAAPSIKLIYKIVEDANFLRPYDIHRRKFGNERFRYHGTSRQCSLGNTGQTKLCTYATCAICNILRTSYQVSVAKASGAFGAGIYTSSASNKAHSYSTNGILLLNKTVLGRVYNVTQFEQVKSCPPGYNSVEFDRMNGQLNETILYTNDAIRPVFLIVF